MSLELLGHICRQSVQTRNSRFNLTLVLLAGKAVATATTVAKKKSLLIATPAKMKMHLTMLLPQGLHVIFCQQVRKFLSWLELLVSLQADVLDDGCSLPPPSTPSLGLRMFYSPPTNADALRMMEKSFEPNAYLIEGRQARAVNKGVCHSAFLISQQQGLSLQNPITPDNYYPVCPLESLVLTDHSSHRHTCTYVRAHTCINKKVACRV